MQPLFSLFISVLLSVLWTHIKEYCDLSGKSTYSEEKIINLGELQRSEPFKSLIDSFHILLYLVNTCLNDVITSEREFMYIYPYDGL